MVPNDLGIGYCWEEWSAQDDELLKWPLMICAGDIIGRSGVLKLMNVNENGT
jgi:hypothetical protein